MLDLHSDHKKNLDTDTDIDSEEMLDQEENPSIWKSYIGTILRLVVLIIIFAAIVWYMLDNLYHTDDNPHEIPVIKSDNAPIKIKPEDPGGMVVPNMDKDIYNNLSNNNDTKTVERVLPLPEEPVNREAIIEEPNPSTTNIKTDVSNAEKVVNDESNNIPDSSKSIDNANNDISASSTSKLQDTSNNNPEKIVPPEDSTKNINTDNSPTLNKIESSDAENSNKIDQKPVNPNFQKNENATAGFIKPLPLKKDKLTHKNTKASNGVTGYKVQLAAFKSQKEVSIEWEKIKTRYSNILGKYNHLVEKKNLGDKGTFYRLQVGPFQSEAEARMLCQKLSTHKQNCFVVKR